MDNNRSRPYLAPILGHEVAMEVLRCIGAFRLLKEALIISYNMQDYDFWGHGRLSSLLRRQLANGARVTLMTTPPPGRGSNKAFKNKFILLEELDRNGVYIYLNEMLHAKAYLFLDNRELKTTIVGSANLTEGGFGLRKAPADSWLELALITYEPKVHHLVSEVIQNKLIGNSRTSDFSTWVAVNRKKIALAKGGK
ncbi:phospholipase D family protein [bacterium]|nr:phospholipase D family protein [bacterium]